MLVPGIYQSYSVAHINSESEVAQSCLTLCNPMDCSLPSSSVYGIFQAKVLEWVAVSFCRGSSQPQDRTPVFLIAGGRFSILSHQGSPHIYIHIQIQLFFSDSFPIWVIIEYWREFPVLYSRSFLIIYFVFSYVYMLISNSEFIPLPVVALVTISLFSKSVSLFLVCK